MAHDRDRAEKGWALGSDASACGLLLLLAAFFVAGIVQLSALRGNVAAGSGLALITISALLVTPKLLTSLIPVGWLSGYLERHEDLRRSATPHARRVTLAYSQAILIQGGLAIRHWTSYDDLGAGVFGIGILALVATYVYLAVFQAAYRTTRDFKNLPAGSDWCARIELDLQRILGNEPVWKLAGLLFVAGTLVTALSL
jgi:hypothetical protein